MSDLRELLGKQILLIDGAMGTLLMEAGVRPEEGFDLQNIKKPAAVREIHRKYLHAGADIIETNTFGANRIKLEDHGASRRVAEINKAGVTLAKEAAENEAFVCGSIGPLGKLIEPLGEVSFDLAAEVFAEQAKAMEEAGADCVSIETISDLQEMRAAVVGIKQHTALPIIASLTYDANGRTVFGTPPEAAVVVLEALGVDVISANCSTGPEGMIDVSRKLIEESCKPVMVMPNAGMPEMRGDLAVYNMPPESFARFGLEFARMGVSVIGGCCGTTPEHIAALRRAIPRATRVVRPSVKIKLQKVGNEEIYTCQKMTSKFASRTGVLNAGPGKFLAIGERINPTGKKLLGEDIRSGSFSLLRAEAASQTKAKADLLDINASIPDGDDAANMKKAVEVAGQASPLPFSIDSPSTEALEAGLKAFCGKALLNSVNGKTESIKKVLPLVKRYGAAFIGLTLDEKGIPKSAEERVRIADRIIKSAMGIGINRENIYIDTLVMTAGIGLEQPLEALKAISIIKEKYGVRTSLGISNISHGLPNRNRINALFLRLALLYGLDAAIMDVTDPETRKALMMSRLFVWNKEKRKQRLIKELEQAVEKARSAPRSPASERKTEAVAFRRLGDIEKAVIDGDAGLAASLTGQALDMKVDPQEIIDDALTRGMETVGEKFSKKTVFLPQVLSSAEAMARGFELCKERIPRSEAKRSGKVLLATVRGDIHDIGKNIVRMLLENHGFEVTDLGKDVPAEAIIEKAKEERPDAIALSALLTTTMLEMREVKNRLKEAGLDIPVIIGGAVVTPDFAEKIKAEYGSDAAEAVKLAKQIIKAAKK